THSIPYELYNITQDPYEKKNLAAKYPERLKHLKKEINDWYPLPKKK
ncbi:Arylsulfatase, partial [hydrothermal vent metagenome]